MSDSSAHVSGKGHDDIPAFRENANRALVIAEEDVAGRRTDTRNVRILLKVRIQRLPQRVADLEDVCFLVCVGVGSRQRFCVEEVEVSPLRPGVRREWEGDYVRQRHSSTLPFSGQASGDL